MSPARTPRSRSASKRCPTCRRRTIDDLKLERLTVEPDESAVDEQLKQLASQTRAGKTRRRSTRPPIGDLVVIDFEGKVGGEPFEGGKGEDMSVELGSGRLIPGFEDQLVGAKAGDKREVNVTFPDDYPAENLKGKDATFDGDRQGGEDRRRDQGRRRVRQVAGPRQASTSCKGLIRGQQSSRSSTA